MGHAVSILTFKASTPKGKIVASCDDWGTRNKDLRENPNPGLGYPIQWLDKTFNSLEEAEEWLDKQSGRYKQLAVKFWKPVGSITGSPRVLAAQKKITEAYESWSKSLKLTGNSEFVGCKSCGSKVARKYIGDYRCPVCNWDLRSETARAQSLSKRATYEKAVNNKKTVIKALESKMKKELWYAVLCEVHC